MAHLLRDTMLCVCLLLVSSIQLVLGTQGRHWRAISENISIGSAECCFADAVGPIGEMMGRMPVQVMPDTSTAGEVGSGHFV